MPKPTEIFDTPESNLKYCPTCIQMTNHNDTTCLKCGLADTTEIEEIIQDVPRRIKVDPLWDSWLKQSIHQQLQKVREETIRDMERKMMGWSGTATAMLKDYRKISLS